MLLITRRARESETRARLDYGKKLMIHLFQILKKIDFKTKILYITEKAEKLIFFPFLFRNYPFSAFSAYTEKLKINFFKILIIFNNLSKYVKSDFF